MSSFTSMSFELRECWLLLGYFGGLQHLTWPSARGVFTILLVFTVRQYDIVNFSTPSEEDTYRQEVGIFSCLSAPHPSTLQKLK